MSSFCAYLGRHRDSRASIHTSLHMLSAKPLSPLSTITAANPVSEGSTTGHAVCNNAIWLCIGGCGPVDVCAGSLQSNTAGVAQKVPLPYTAPGAMVHTVPNHVVDNVVDMIPYTGVDAVPYISFSFCPVMIVQTDSYLEQLTDTVAEAEMSTQTDPFRDRPSTPLFISAKAGLDATTQIEAGDLFDFDFEVRACPSNFCRMLAPVLLLADKACTTGVTALLLCLVPTWICVTQAKHA